MILILSFAQKTLDFGEIMVYIMFASLIFCIGILLNTILLMQNHYMRKPDISNISLEFNTTVGYFSTLFAPIISVMDEPYPTLAIWVFVILEIIMVL